MRRLLRSRSLSTAATPASVSSSEAATFHATLERNGAVTRVTELAAMQSGSSAVSRELDTLGTLPRQLAHMLLVRPVIRSGDLMNPASTWGDLEPVEGGHTPVVSMEALRAEEEARAAFEGIASSLGGGSEGGAGTAAAPRGGGAAGQAKDVEDVSPPIGGALSYINAGEVAPVGAGEALTTPNPVALLYIDAILEYLGGTLLPRLVRTSQAPSPPSSSSFPKGHVESLVASLYPANPAQPQPLPPPVEKWLTTLPPSDIPALASLVRAGRGGGGKVREERIKGLQAVVELLGAVSRKGGSALPTAMALHTSLSNALAALPKDFTLHHSAAAAVARDSIARLHAAVTTLNECASHTLHVQSYIETLARGETTTQSPLRKAAGAAQGQQQGQQAQASPSYELKDAPTVESVVATPSFEIPTLRVLEVASGKTLALALAPMGGSHTPRLQAGHVPTMLSPLMHLLTPSEWGTLLAITRVSLPDSSPYLLPPVALPSSATTTTLAAATTSSTPLVGGGDFAVLTDVAGGGTMVNATGLSNSNLNALAAVGAIVPTAPPSAATPDSAAAAAAAASVAAVKAAAGNAPTQASRNEYLRYVVRSRAAADLLALTREAEAGARAWLSTLEEEAKASGDVERVGGVEALKVTVDSLVGALARGERVGDEEAAMRQLRQGEVALGEEYALRAGFPLTSRLLLAFKGIVGGASTGGSGPWGDGARAGDIGSVTNLMHASSPSLTGPAAALRHKACTPPLLASVDFGPGMPKSCGGEVDGGASRVFQPAAAAAAPGGGGLLISGTPSSSSSSSTLVRGLGEEGSGGILDRAEAYAAQGVLEDGVWPPKPRLLPWDLSWASTRAGQGFPGGSDGGLGERNAAVLRAPPPGLPSSSSSSFTRGGGGKGKKGGESEAQGEGGEEDALSIRDAPGPFMLPHSLDSPTLNTALAKTLDSLNYPNVSRGDRLARASAELAQARKFAEGGEAQAEVVGEAWREYTYAPPSGYRSSKAHTLTHTRLLEACEARDLGAVWALWMEACRLNPQEGGPDFLALEIVMDACARAGRSDLVFHVLWPRVMEWRIVPTPSMWYILLKAAAAAATSSSSSGVEMGVGGKAATTTLPSAAAAAAAADLPLELLTTLEREGLTHVDARHFSTVIACLVGCGRFSEAFALFNRMRKLHHIPPPGLFTTLFRALGKAGRGEDCVHVWRAMVGAPAMEVPPSLYTLILTTFAGQGNTKVCEEVVRRMKRKLDGEQRPTLTAWAALFDAYVAAGEGNKAAEVLKSMTSARLFTPGTEARLGAMKAAVAKFEGVNKAPSSPSAAVGRVGKVVVEEVESLASLLPIEVEELK